MKILFLEQFSELGGGQRCLLDLLPAVREREWNALVAAPGSGPLFEMARVSGAETATIALGPYSSGKKTAVDAARFVFDTAHLRSWISAQNANLIFLSAARPLVAAALGARGRPVIFYTQHFFGKRYAVSTAGWAIRHARATVIANSRHVAAPFQPHVPPDRLHLVYNAVGEIPFAIRKSTRRIGLIGRIAPMKGQKDFLLAARALAPSLPDVRFVICGAPMFSSAGYFETIKRLAEGLPVDFLGWRDDIDAVLSNLDLLVLPSTSAESNPRVMLEAFSAGVPVVAYASGGIPEFIRDGKNGFLIPECEPRALARKILDITAMDLAPVAMRARADWERNYTLARYREQMIEIIAACVATT